MENNGFNKNILILVIGLIGIFGCNKERDKLTEEKEILVGKWEWQFTEVYDHCDGYLKSYILNPDSLNKTYQIQFLKKGYIRFMEDNKTIKEYSIQFSYIDVPENGIVQSTKEFSFMMFFDQDKSNHLFGIGSQKDIQFNYYPLDYWEDCQRSISNRFKKIE